MNAVVFHSPYTSGFASPAPQPVLTQFLQQELNLLLSSLRKQVRNVVAVGSWLARPHRPGDAALKGQLAALQGSRPEELSFHLPASDEAFSLFTRTLLRTNAYLRANARVDARQQVLKVRVDFQHLEAWEFELSVNFEQITPAAYVKTLLYDRPGMRLGKAS
ncbi:MAG: hypothetical protein ACO1O1_15700 [Adhaeribacter sp.]